MQKITTILADRHPIFLEGLCRIIRECLDLDVIGTALDGEQTVRLVKELKPDVVIMDVAMPKLNGIEATRQIKLTCLNTAVIIISANTYNYHTNMIASLEAGAAGYLLKNTAPREMINAVYAVHAGEAIFDMNTISRVFSDLLSSFGKDKKDDEEPHRREIEVLRLVARGKNNRDIAKELCISERTVQTHMVNIFRKLRVGSRTEATLHGFLEGWLDLYSCPMSNRVEF